MPHTIGDLLVNLSSKASHQHSLQPCQKSAHYLTGFSVHTCKCIFKGSLEVPSTAAGGACLIIQVLDGHVEAIVHQPLAGTLVVAVQAIDEAASLVIWQSKIDVEGGPSCQSCSVSSVDTSNN